ncbi:MAG: hypothetical protein V3T05_07590 [Myxococcota bacterium]
MLIHLLTIVAGLQVPVASDGASGHTARVLLDGQRGELDLEADPPRLQFSVLARSTLDVPVDMVEVGVLYAGDQATLRDVDPGAAYRGKQPEPHAVGMVRRRFDVSLLPGKEIPLQLDIPLQPHGPEAIVFRTHVLSYRLAAAPPALLFELLGTEAAADEAAVVETLALAGDPAARRAARRRWGNDNVLKAALAAKLSEEVGEDAGHDQTMAWVFAVRGLGVIGGELAVATLQPLLADVRLRAFDEELQVLRIARMLGSRLETPLAFAIPPEARRMQDVVTAALTDASSLDWLAEASTGAAASPPGDVAVTAAPIAVAVGSEPTEPEPAVPAWAWAAIGGLAVGVIAMILLRRLGHGGGPRG